MGGGSPIRWLGAAFAAGIALAGTSGTVRWAVAAVAAWAAAEAWAGSRPHPPAAGPRACRRHAGWAWALALLLTAGAGWASAAARLLPAPTSGGYPAAGLAGLVSPGGPGRRATVAGVVVRAPEARPDGTVLVLRADAFRLPADRAWRPATGLLRVFVRAAPDPGPPADPGDARKSAWSLGDRLTVGGTLRLPGPPTNPGAWDYAAYLSRHGIVATLSTTPAAVRPNPDPPDPAFVPARLALAFRDAVERVHRATMPGPAAAVLDGMLFGATGDLPADVAEAYRATGTYHVLAVSGSNVAFVVLALAWTLRAVGVPPALNLVVGLGMVAAYAAMTGGGPSVGRAAWMAALALGAVLARRRRDPWTGLAASALLLLALDPGALFDAGFQLTFAATAALLALAGPVDRRLAAAAPRLPQPLRQLLPATAVAQLGVAPLVATHFGVVPVAGLLANPLVVPAAGLLVITGGLAGVVGLAWLDGARLLGWFNTAVVEVTTAWVRLLSAVPGAAAAAAPWPVAAVVGWSAGLAACSAGLSGARGGWRRRARWVALACAVWVAAGWTWAAWAPRPLEAVFFDVGQGDAALVRAPSGRAVLVDAGPPGTGRAIIVPYLRRAGIRRLDAVLISHPHTDHAGGFPEVAAAVPVGLLVEPGPGSGPGSATVSAAVHRFTAAAGDRWDLGGGVSLEVLWPPDRGDGGPMAGDPAPPGDPRPPGPGAPTGPAGERDAAGEAGEDARVNNRSLVVLVRAGPLAVLFTGDLEAEGEAGLLAQTRAAGLRATVLKVGHHGSGGSTSDPFLEAVRPWAAVVSVGPNRYGHPHAGVLERLAAAGSAVWRTDREGAVVLTFDGRRLALSGYASGRAVTRALLAPAVRRAPVGGQGGGMEARIGGAEASPKCAWPTTKPHSAASAAARPGACT